MKKIFLVSLLFGSLSFAQATSITLTTADLHGQNAYEYLVSLAPDQTIDTASLVFNLKLTATGYNTFSYDIINRNDASAIISSENDQPGDYFTSHSPYSTTAVQLGTKTFPYLNYVWSYTYDFLAQGTLNTLNSYAADGSFDFGFDPDCTYSGSVTFNYTTITNRITTVPDSVPTFGLLGISMLGLAALRRKFCVN
jgi:hypothetical protein